MSVFQEVADIQTSDMLQLPVPEAEYENVVLPASEEQKEILQSISERADRVRNREVDPSEDNMLKITTDGRKLALDQRLINDMLPDTANNKVSACAERCFKVWQETKEQKVVDTITVCSPISGLAADLSTAPDEAFAEKMMGDGAVVTPEDPYVRAPEDGEVAFVFDTKHAIGFVTDSGVSLLIHVGIDTVKLNGEGFEALVESGQTVKKGDPMLKLDLEYLKTHAPSVTSPVLCTELEENQRIRLLTDGPVKAGDPLFAIEILA